MYLDGQLDSQLDISSQIWCYLIFWKGHLSQSAYDYHIAWATLSFQVQPKQVLHVPCLDLVNQDWS